MYLLQHVSSEFLLNCFIILFDQLYLRLSLNIIQSFYVYHTIKFRGRNIKIIYIIV